MGVLSWDPEKGKRKGTEKEKRFKRKQNSKERTNSMKKIQNPYFPKTFQPQFTICIKFDPPQFSKGVIECCQDFTVNVSMAHHYALLCGPEKRIEKDKL